ncbi:Uma2 family endonuclease [Anatilimnocola sp. NA78]|uniref:Uma2 family endonuclease n=1 Tax=Anatilimnocola sp. NA78 TaxID=3415683 RepID=UPI003CE4D965
MTAALKLALVSPEDYLASEIDSSVKREYVAGTIHAMTGGTNNHAKIARNILATLFNALGDRHCEAFASDVRIRIRDKRDIRFYYPDASVICEQNPGHELFQDHPVLVAEVLSPSTRRIDDGEKRDAYLTIPSLQYFLVVEQDSPVVVVYRRSETGFDRQIISGLEQRIELPALSISLPLADIFARISFVPE